MLQYWEPILSKSSGRTHIAFYLLVTFSKHITLTVLKKILFSCITTRLRRDWCSGTLVVSRIWDWSGRGSNWVESPLTIKHHPAAGPCLKDAQPLVKAPSHFAPAQHPWLSTLSSQCHRGGLAISAEGRGHVVSDATQLKGCRRFHHRSHRFRPRLWSRRWQEKRSVL